MNEFDKLYPDLIRSRRYNLHGHTQYCDGRATVDEFAAAAYAAGMSHYGFSPHSPIPIPSTCNMTVSSALEYLADICRLREQYDGKIKILASMEIDYLNDDWGPANDYFQSLPLDYRIGSVHFIPTRGGDFVDIDGSPDRFVVNLRERFGGDLRYVVETFFHQSIAMVERGGLDIIGHLDKVAHNASAVDPEVELRPWYRSLVGELMDLVTSKNIAVEVNTKAYAGAHRFFPSVDHWPTLIASGARIVVNSDAHYPDLIDASRSEAYAILDALAGGYNSR